ncbi:hypothetical protein GGI25_005132 [Coemansia spiralis]|uniref:Ketoreductase domain-containing protein n=2 Tax=Coemansia TaxID=4863 RepID=A0A9W8FZ71_9FUNG|nr:hypothetical protein EDC05_006354 [Coemansia umbellata]KAJ2619995.1 hypothetical protein GGI26_005393 [Coemansia sp. RSA 1358]KAJ2672423.1 hypothetical protein GGI25_005132 [Coemansia spiralis]
MSRVAVVTGASRGLGLAISKQFLHQGVTVIGVARSAERLSELAQALSQPNAKFIACAADITSPSEVQKVRACVEEQKSSTLCALINNAGTIDPIAKLSDIDIAAWQRVLDVNITPVVSLTQQLLPYLRHSRATVVNVSSGAALRAYHGWAAYCASKAAVNMLTQSFATEEPHVVFVAIMPGVVDTDMQSTIRKAQHAMKPEEFDKFSRLHSEGKLLSPEVPAATIVRVALCATNDVSGQLFSFDSPELEKYHLAGSQNS